jgi:hypothetical protein
MTGGYIHKNSHAGDRSDQKAEIQCAWDMAP